MDSDVLFVIVGPTAVGKTEVALRVAEHLGCPIVSADSRQMFRDIPIGTAAPTGEEQARVKHYFVGQLALEDYYNASQYEKEALQVITELMASGNGSLVLTGGSMMYVDAVCNGIDVMPDIEPDVRTALKAQYAAEGLAPLVAELQCLDPEYAAQCDLQNQARVIHALEICRQTGKPYSSFRTNQRAERPFRIVKIGLDRPREELFDRINRRVTAMVGQGFCDEARRVLPYRHCNSLNTVGFKEMFRHFDGDWPLDMALERIRKNTRVYAKKQLTWFRRDESIRWFHPDNIEHILQYVDAALDGRNNNS